MDETTLDSLSRALEATPENPQLRMVLVGAYLERGEPRRAYELVEGFGPDDLRETEPRQLAARACLEAGELDEALKLAEGDSPEILLLRSRIYLAQEQHKEGLEAYRAAVAANPSLEDVSLRDRLSVNVRTFPQAQDGDGPRLRVISNDDTDQTEVTRLLMPQEEDIDFSGVGGLDEIKKQIHKRIILPFQKPSLFKRFKKRIGGGILLYGPPGCGKTLLARATAGECDASFLNVAIADVLDMYIGESERKLQAIFEKARASTPAVLFFDEIEALGGKRQYTREATSSKLVSHFLSEMDGFTQDNSGVLILAATNVPWAVDAAFRRPGRFDRLLFVPPPDRAAREAILGIRLADRPVDASIDLSYFAKRTSGYSGADLDQMVETASDEAIDESIESGKEVPIHAGHLRASLKEVKPTTLEWLTTARNYARYANEAGHYDDVLEFLKKHGR